jgi:hypothetical protein
MVIKKAGCHQFLMVRRPPLLSKMDGDPAAAAANRLLPPLDRLGATGEHVRSVTCGSGCGRGCGDVWGAVGWSGGPDTSIGGLKVHLGP